MNTKNIETKEVLDNIKKLGILLEKVQVKEALALQKIVYAQRSLLHDDDPLIEIYRVSGALFLLTNQLELARMVVEDAYDDARSRKSMLMEGSCCGILSSYLQKMRCFTESIDVLQRGIEILGQFGMESDIGLYYTDLSGAYFHLGNYTEAAKYIEKAIPLLEKNGPLAFLMRTLTSATAVYIRTNEYHKALEYGLRALSLKEQQQVNSGIHTTLLNIGMIYSEIDMPEKARIYYQRAIDTPDPIDNGTNLARVYNNLGNLELTCGNNDLAINYYRKSLAIKEKLGNLSSIAYAFINIGQFHAEVNNELDLAETYLQKAFTLFSQCELENEVARTKRHMASVALLRNDLPKAEQLYNEAMATAEKNQAIGEQEEFLEFAERLYEAKGDKEAVEQAKKRRAELVERLMNEEKKAAIQDTEMKYQRNYEKQGSILIPRCFDMLRRRP